jgi:hypothetical protein
MNTVTPFGHWLRAWNAHDLEAILALYAEDVEFSSPMTAKLGSNPTGVVRGKAALRELFDIGLRRYPSLRFVPIEEFRGIDRSALLYVGIEGRPVVEIHALDPSGLIVAAWALHPPGGGAPGDGE